MSWIKPIGPVPWDRSTWPAIIRAMFPGSPPELIQDVSMECAHFTIKLEVDAISDMYNEVFANHVAAGCRECVGPHVPVIELLSRLGA